MCVCVCVQLSLFIIGGPPPSGPIGPPPPRPRPRPPICILPRCLLADHAGCTQGYWQSSLLPAWGIAPRLRGRAEHTTWVRASSSTVPGALPAWGARTVCEDAVCIQSSACGLTDARRVEGTAARSPRRSDLRSLCCALLRLCWVAAGLRFTENTRDGCALGWKSEAQVWSDKPAQPPVTWAFFLCSPDCASEVQRGSYQATRQDVAPSIRCCASSALWSTPSPHCSAGLRRCSCRRARECSQQGTSSRAGFRMSAREVGLQGVTCVIPCRMSW